MSIINDTRQNQLPDVATTSHSHIHRSIDRVGMSDIPCPIQIELNGHDVTVAASCNAGISLDDPTVKGIHMSRLYLTLQEQLAYQKLSHKKLEQTLSAFIQSHKDMSKAAYLELSFDYIRQKKSLKSSLTGHQIFPITIAAELNNNSISYTLIFSITYSSTCPCSAALSRQAIQDKFHEDFQTESLLEKDKVADWLSKEESILATPHSQRSVAELTLEYNSDFDFDFDTVIAKAEEIIQTAVQTAVKRIDEQAFAVQNGQNLMFCEDAVRRFDHWLESEETLSDYHVDVEHQESLHPHNAVASTRKK